MSEREKYQRYLCSPEWFAKRNAVMERSRGRCERCGRKADHVHHLTYIRKYNELLTDLQAVCEQCHESIHYPKQPVANVKYSLTNLEREFFEIVLFGNRAVAELAMDRATEEWFESVEGIYLNAQLRSKNGPSPKAIQMIKLIDFQREVKKKTLDGCEHYKDSIDREIQALSQRLKLNGPKDMSPPPGIQIPF